MSRSYRITVRESVSRVVRAEDCVSTQLEILEVLPPEQMAALLEEELERRGYKREGENMVRRDKDVTVTVNPATGTVTVGAEASEKVAVDGEREARGYDDVGPGQDSVREAARRELQKDLEKKIQEKVGGLQGKVTDRLEGELGDLRQELDQAVNRVTAEALKRKAAGLGQIKEMTEDPQTGSLTIVVEV
jgi:hypothetical protein